MSVTIPDMGWVEEGRRQLGISRDDLRQELQTQKGIKVDLSSVHNWCKGRQVPRFDIGKALIEIVDSMLDDRAKAARAQMKVAQKTKRKARRITDQAASEQHNLYFAFSPSELLEQVAS